MLKPSATRSGSDDRSGKRHGLHDGAARSNSIVSTAGPFRTASVLIDRQTSHSSKRASPIPRKESGGRQESGYRQRGRTLCPASDDDPMLKTRPLTNPLSPHRLPRQTHHDRPSSGSWLAPASSSERFATPPAVQPERCPTSPVRDTPPGSGTYRLSR